LSDTAKYTMTLSIARSLCDSWASCLYSRWTWVSLVIRRFMKLIFCRSA